MALNPLRIAFSAGRNENLPTNSAGSLMEVEQPEQEGNGDCANDEDRRDRTTGHWVNVI